MKKNSRPKCLLAILALAALLPSSGRCFYNSSTGRWLSRDPLQERGCRNVYVCALNNLPGMFDPRGLRPIPFVFDAFINGRLGTWLWEPYNRVDQFKTDERDFGAFNPDPANARVFSAGSIESSKIGSAADGGVDAKSDTGMSHRRHNMNFNPFGTPDWYYEERKGDIRNPDPDVADYKPLCRTDVTFSPSAGYPFTPQWLTPNIDYSVTFTFYVTGPSEVMVYLKGAHDKFPDYEAYVDGDNFYKFPTTDSGPGPINLNTQVQIPQAKKVISGVDVPAGCCRHFP